MFEDQKIELLPARTTMKYPRNIFAAQNFNTAAAAALNVGNINVGGDQANVAAAVALAGSNVFVG